MEEVSPKLNDSGKVKKAGGRPVHDGWHLYHFVKVDGDKGKSVAKCIKCHNILKNTTISRLLAHRKKCGRVPETILNSSATSTATTTVIHQSYQPQPPSSVTVIEQPHVISKIEIEEYDEQTPQHQQQEVLWTTQTHNVDSFMDESLNTVTPTSMTVLDEDIRRHRRSQQSQRKRTENSAIDAALSSFLIGCNLTFDVVDSKHFKHFVSVLNPDYRLPTSSQLTSKVLSQLKSGVDAGGGSSGGERSRASRKRKYYSSDDDDSDYE